MNVNSESKPLDHLTFTQQNMEVIHGRWMDLSRQMEPLQLQATHIKQTIIETGKNIESSKNNPTKAQKEVFREWSKLQTHTEKQVSQVKEQTKILGRKIENVTPRMDRYRQKVNKVVAYRAPSKLAFWKRKLTPEERLTTAVVYTSKIFKAEQAGSLAHYTLSKNLSTLMNRTLLLQRAVNSQVEILGTIHQTEKALKAMKNEIQGELSKYPGPVQEAMKQKIAQLDERRGLLKKMETEWSEKGTLEGIAKEYQKLSAGEIQESDIAVLKGQAWVTEVQQDANIIRSEALLLGKAHDVQGTIKQMIGKMEKKLKLYSPEVQGLMAAKMDLLKEGVDHLDSFKTSLQESDMETSRNMASENAAYPDAVLESAHNIRNDIQEFLSQNSPIKLGLKERIVATINRMFNKIPAEKHATWDGMTAHEKVSMEPEVKAASKGPSKTEKKQLRRASSDLAQFKKIDKKQADDPSKAFEEKYTLYQDILKMQESVTDPKILQNLDNIRGKALMDLRSLISKNPTVLENKFGMIKFHFSNYARLAFQMAELSEKTIENDQKLQALKGQPEPPLEKIEKLEKSAKNFELMGQGWTQQSEEAISELKSLQQLFSHVIDESDPEMEKFQTRAQEFNEVMSNKGEGLTQAVNNWLTDNSSLKERLQSAISGTNEVFGSTVPYDGKATTVVLTAAFTNLMKKDPNNAETYRKLLSEIEKFVEVGKKNAQILMKGYQDDPNYGKVLKKNIEDDSQMQTKIDDTRTRINNLKTSIAEIEAEDPSSEFQAVIETVKTYSLAGLDRSLKILKNLEDTLPKVDTNSSSDLPES